MDDRPPAARRARDGAVGLVDDRRRIESSSSNERSPGWRARRWVVEACHSWLNRNRALLVRWSKKPENHLALLQLACGLIAFKKAHAARLAHALPG